MCRGSHLKEKVNNLTFIYIPILLSVRILVETHGYTFIHNLNVVVFASAMVLDWV